MKKKNAGKSVSDTAICTNCRKHFTFSVAKIPEQTEASDNIGCTILRHVSNEESIDEVSTCSNTKDEAGEYLSIRKKRSSAVHIPQYFDSESSQVTTISGDSQKAYSQCSLATEFSEQKVEYLNQFLELSDISPIKEKRKPLYQIGQESKRLCVSKVIRCMSEICETIYPGEGPDLEALVIQALSSHSELSSPKENSEMILADIYKSAESWTLKRQILSILSETKNYNQTKELLPDLTQWRFYAAKHHAENVGIGNPVPQVPIHIKRIDDQLLDHFIDYITSSSVVKDLPYGTKSMTLSTGEIVEIPNLIRSLAPTTLINQYLRHCEFEGVNHLGTSTLYKLLNDCAASVRKSVEGIDYYVAEGGRAFMELEELIDAMKLPNTMKQELQTGKQYLKTDYKVHVQKQSPIADHCRLYALSSFDPHFSERCNHSHEQCCEQCSKLDKILNRLTYLVNDHTWENKDSVLFKLENAVSKIKEWKVHLLRSRNQEESRSNIIDNLGSHSALIVCDWAMKFLPRKFREGQTDWFAKRGINWHVAVCFYRKDDQMQNLTYVHIFNSQVSQDASLTSSILCDVAKDLLTERPNIQNINFFL